MKLKTHYWSSLTTADDQLISNIADFFLFHLKQSTNFFQCGRFIDNQLEIQNGKSRIVDLLFLGVFYVTLVRVSIFLVLWIRESFFKIFRRFLFSLLEFILMYYPAAAKLYTIMQ